VIEVAEARDLELKGFAAGTTVTVQITRPDGGLVNAQFDPNAQGQGDVSWISLPGEPIGDHQLLATQGDRQVRAVFTVRNATEPHVSVVPWASPPGSTFQVAVAGLPTNQFIPLRLYRNVGETYWYVMDLPSLQTNERGEGIAPLPTLPTDPEDRYLVVTEPRVTGRDWLNGQLLLSNGGDPTLSRDPNQVAAQQAQATIVQANSVWSAVVSDPNRPLSELDQVLAGARLAQAKSEIESARAQSQTHLARLTGPVIVQNARELNRDSIEATVTEQWEDLLLNPDGTLANDLSGVRERQYTLERRFEPCYCWLVVDAK
jgi:hypothetical protein